MFGSGGQNVVTCVGLASLALAALGCATEGDETTVATGELLSNEDFLWTGSPITIPVCWTNPTAASSGRRTWVRSTIESTWSLYSPVNFVGWGTCPSGTWNGIKVTIDQLGGWATLGSFDSGGVFRSSRYLQGQVAVTANLGFGGVCRDTFFNYCESDSECVPGSGQCCRKDHTPFQTCNPV